jgi:uncharacterized DUF497 family protein
MDTTVRFVFRDASFEWDSAKAESNLAKHAVAFERACQVFFDPFRRVVDTAESDEARAAIVGYTESESLLTVVHLVLHEEVIRIISARRASKEERKLYEQH